MAKADLKIDWATYAAAKYACEHWHYSKTVPVGKLVKIGAWEEGEFIGVVLFALGMNKNLGSPYGLQIGECCELVRIAMRQHKTHISRILSIALKFLKEKCPGIRMIVSFADPTAGHHGGIYQATNWIYSGDSAKNFEYRIGDKRLNKRAYTGVGFDSPRMAIPKNAVRVNVQGKHRYLYPLDDAMRKQILPLSKPYPKRAGSIENDAPAHQRDEGGVIPTPALQESDTG